MAGKEDGFEAFVPPYLPSYAWRRAGLALPSQIQSSVSRAIEAEPERWLEAQGYLSCSAKMIKSLYLSVTKTKRDPLFNSD